MINIAICDDEEAWHLIIKDRLECCLNSEFDFKYHILCLDSLEVLKESIEQNKVDFAFVDISMYGINSIDWAIENLFEFDTPIIFTTAYPQSASNLYDCKNSCYYIIKDRLESKLKTAVETAMKKIENNGSSLIPFRRSDSRYKIRACDILYIDTSAGKNYIAVHKVDKTVLNIPISIRNCMELLPDFFLQCHNGCIINCRHVIGPISKSQDGMHGKKCDEKFFMLDSDETVPITLRKYKEIVSKFYDIVHREI